uniref:Vomeronasal type-1 receptor n=1 Tax=Capra hircus TaxID=9925 RepID=A0A8C2R6M8_CAPHI
MAAGDLAAGFILLSQTVVGMLGNFSLLYHYLFLYCTGYRLRTVDLIVKNLIVGNILVLFSAGFHSTMTNFGWNHLNSGSACRFFAYVRGVGRGTSIGITCILSVFQAIMISPRNSKWAKLKVQALKFIVPSIFLCWILNLLVNLNYPIFVTRIMNNKSITNRKSFRHCTAIHHDRSGDIFIAMMFFPVVFGSTVFILYRHKQRVQNFHRISVSSISSAESRATKTILLLVSIFVIFNTLSSISYIVLGLLNNPSLFISTMSSIITSYFPTVSPFLLMSRDPTISRLCFAGKRNTNAPTPMRKM